MSDCGHASGVTYTGCMKCDLDKLKECNAELEAQIEAVKGCKRYTKDAGVGSIYPHPDGHLLRRMDVLAALETTKK